MRDRSRRTRAARTSHRARAARIVRAVMLVAVILPPALAAPALAPVRVVDDSEETAVVAAVQQLFDAIASGDPAMAEAVLMPEGQLVSVRPGETEGSTVLRTTTHREFLEQLGTVHEEWLERMWNAKALVHGHIAMVWTPYDFYRGGEFSHCGVDLFNLVRTNEGWKIAGGVYTVERTGCTDSPLGPPGAPLIPSAGTTPPGS